MTTQAFYNLNFAETPTMFHFTAWPSTDCGMAFGKVMQDRISTWGGCRVEIGRTTEKGNTASYICFNILHNGIYFKKQCWGFKNYQSKNSHPNNYKPLKKNKVRNILYKHFTIYTKH